MFSTSSHEPASDAKPPGDGFTGGVSAPLLKNLSSQIASKMIFDKDFTTLAWKVSLPCHLSAQPVVGNNEKVYMGQ